MSRTVSPSAQRPYGVALVAQEWAVAILDRLIHDAYRIELKGESMRKTRSGLTPRGSQQ